MPTTCEILDCTNDAAPGTTNGIHLCERCTREGSSVGSWWCVRFGGRWHGVRGIRYTAEQAAVFPGLHG